MKHFVKMKDSHSAMFLPFCWAYFRCNFKKGRKVSAFTSFSCHLSISSYVWSRKYILKGTSWGWLIYLTPHSYKKKKENNPKENTDFYINVCIALPNKILVQNYEILKTAWWRNILFSYVCKCFGLFSKKWGRNLIIRHECTWEFYTNSTAIYIQNSAIVDMRSSESTSINIKYFPAE